MSLIELTFRLDDAHESFNKSNWDRCVDLIENYASPGLIGVIPLCLDKSIDFGLPNPDFGQWCQDLRSRGWTFAHHGYTHMLRKGRSFSIRYATKGEFNNSSFELIVNELRLGKDLLKKLGIETKVFFAPRHSYSDNLLRALKYMGYEVVSDGVSNFNFHYRGLKFIPQYLSFPNRYLWKRSYTICLHPSTMNELEFNKLEELLTSQQFTPLSWDEIVNRKSRTWHVSWVYRLFYSLRYRRIL